PGRLGHRGLSALAASGRAAARQGRSLKGTIVAQTRIVIAEDESIPRMDLREMLENLGYLVVGEAADGVSAVNLARELRPDLVVMDIKMPEMDGIAAARVLTEERISPVLLVTAYSHRELVDNAKDA